VFVLCLAFLSAVFLFLFLASHGRVVPSRWFDRTLLAIYYPDSSRVCLFVYPEPIGNIFLTIGG